MRPQFRGQGAGLALLQWVVGEARTAGYREMLGDTMPVMQRALAMYERLGFEQTGPYMPDATPGCLNVFGIEASFGVLRWIPGIPQDAGVWILLDISSQNSYAVFCFTKGGLNSVVRP